MSTIVLQPRELPSGVLPYPWFIDDETLEVGRQDFWRGDPAKLAGFADPDDPYRLVVDGFDWPADPVSAVGLSPVFENSSGEWATWTQMVIESVRTEEDE